MCHACTQEQHDHTKDTNTGADTDTDRDTNTGADTDNDTGTIKNTHG